MSDEPIFEVHARRPEHRNQARMLQILINQPYFQNKAFEAIEKYLADVVIPQMMQGTNTEVISWKTFKSPPTQ